MSNNDVRFCGGNRINATQTTLSCCTSLQNLYVRWILLTKLYVDVFLARNGRLKPLFTMQGIFYYNIWMNVQLLNPHQFYVLHLYIPYTVCWRGTHSFFHFQTSFTFYLDSFYGAHSINPTHPSRYITRNMSFF